MTDSPLSTLYSDVRLERKREEIGNGFTGSQNCSIHSTFTDYNEQKGVYRFFSNPKVTETILIKELQRKCSSAVEGKRVLAILDTSTITLDTYLGRITDFEGLGLIGKNQHSSSFGLFLHPIYVIDEADSTPYGLAEVLLHNRSMEQNPLNVKEKRSLKAKMPIERKESFRWVGPSIKARDTVLSKAENLTFVMDREADIWEVYERIPNRKTDVVVRSSQNRRIINSLGNQTKLHTEIGNQKSNGTYEIELPRKLGRKRGKAIVDIKMNLCEIVPSQFNGTDILPTLCELVDATLPGDRAIDGVDAFNAFLGKEVEREQSAIWFYPNHEDTYFRMPQMAMRKDGYALVGWLPEKPDSMNLRNWMASYDPVKLELYDMVHDPMQMDDISKQEPEKVRSMEEEMVGLWREMRDEGLK